MIERASFDGVHEAARLAGCRNQVIPAPRREMSSAPVEPRHFNGDWIQAVEIVEQPRVEAVSGKRCLNAAEVKSGCRLGHSPSITRRAVWHRTCAVQQTAETGD